MADTVKRNRKYSVTVTATRVVESSAELVVMAEDEEHAAQVAAETIEGVESKFWKSEGKSVSESFDWEESSDDVSYEYSDIEPVKGGKKS